MMNNTSKRVYTKKKNKTAANDQRSLPRFDNLQAKKYSDDLVVLKTKQACLVNNGAEAHLSLNTVDGFSKTDR